MIDLLVLAAAVLSPADRTAIYRAAGAVRRGPGWVMCVEEQRAVARVEPAGDLNGDGRPEAVVSEDGSFCHGMTGTGFVLLSKQADGRWKQMTGMSGIPEFLKTKGVAGWPDISVGGPGFCFPVLRWNGREYANHRMQYQGKPCRKR